MKSSSIKYLVLLGLSLHGGPDALAQEGFKLPNINPFKSKSDQATAASDKPESKFRLPSLPSPPSLPKSAIPSLPPLAMPKLEFPKLGGNSAEPSAWVRLNRSSKRLFSKTKTALMPWTEKKSSQSVAAAGSNPYRVARRPEKSSFMSNLFGPQTKEPEIDSVNKYLALPRPSPYE